MILVELDKYAEENNYKQPANNPNAASPDNITHARLYYNTFAGSNYIQGSFVPGSNSSVEFDDDGVTYTKYKLFVSTDGTTYTERKSFGGTDGKDCITSQHLLSPLGIANWYLPVKKSQGGSDVVVFDSLSNIITGAGISVSSDAVDYYYVRGRLVQQNTVQSGKAFFGATFVDENTGLYSASIINPTQTIADQFNRTTSSKVSTGKYYLQFRTDIGSGLADGFIEEIAGTFSYKFESFVRPLYKKRNVSSEQVYTELTGTASIRSSLNTVTGTGTEFTSELTVGDYVRFSGGSQTDVLVASIESDTQFTASYSLSGSNNPTGINVTGTIATTNGSPNVVGTGTHFTELTVGNAIGSTPISGGILSITDDTHMTLNANATATQSGQAYFYNVPYATVEKKEVGTFLYSSEIVTELIGYLVLDVDSEEGSTYYSDGRLLLKTYNTSQVLTDNLLESGFTIELRALPL